jgi:PKD repeat protein
VSGPNLDVKITLLQADGKVLLADAQEAILTASITTSLPAGTYYLAIANSGHAASGADYGYSTYGSMGQYAISGSYPISGTTVTQLPPTAVITTSTVSGLAPLPVTFSANNSIGNGNITGYYWTFGDGTTSTVSNVVHTYSTPGTFTASLLITNQFGLTSTKQITINITAPPSLTLHAASYGATGVIQNALLTIKLSVLVADNNGIPVANALVTGAWTGALSGTVTGTTGVNGIATLTPISSKTLKGASAVFTLKSITDKGYTYNPTQNIGSVITLSW